MGRRRESMENPEEQLAWTLRNLKSRSSRLDEEAAAIEPRWQRAEEELDVNPWMEDAAFAEIGDYLLYVISAKDEIMKATKTRVPKISWTLMQASGGETLAGGPARDMAQAKDYARRAYQAAHGYTPGGDA